ncbi:hypothetical protein ACFWTC_25795 [Streptomyces sp. NPDC058619]|uniref:hypothetical protein n=1 Tax=unclassified Streptomyces TaxID=2593676 RepID=UPI00366796D4
MTTTTTTAPAAGPPGPLYRILLVEDDRGDALLVDELLHDTGLRFELTTRTSLADARTELTTRAIDCVLLDLHLPDVHLAGRHDPLLTTREGTREVPAAHGIAHGIALGIVPGRPAGPATEIPLPPAGALTLYTDGSPRGSTATAPAASESKGSSP